MELKILVILLGASLDHVNTSMVIYGCCCFYNIIKPTMDRQRRQNKTLQLCNLGFEQQNWGERWKSARLSRGDKTSCDRLAFSRGQLPIAPSNISVPLGLCFWSVCEEILNKLQLFVLSLSTLGFYWLQLLTIARLPLASHKLDNTVQIRVCTHVPNVSRTHAYRESCNERGCMFHGGKQISIGLQIFGIFVKYVPEFLLSDPVIKTFF